MKKDNIEVRQAAEMIKKALNGNKKYDREIWQAILNLIEKSEYGNKRAEVLVDMPLAPGKNEIEEILDSGFDGVIMQVLDVIQTVFQSVGSVSVAPYSKGLGTRSATLSFTPQQY